MTQTCLRHPTPTQWRRRSFQGQEPHLKPTRKTMTTILKMRSSIWLSSIESSSNRPHRIRRMTASMVMTSLRRALGRKSAHRDLPAQAREAMRRTKTTRETGTVMMPVQMMTKTSTRKR